MKSGWDNWGLIWFCFEILQRWRLHKFSGQLVPLGDCPHGEKVSPYSQFKSLSF